MARTWCVLKLYLGQEKKNSFDIICFSKLGCSPGLSFSSLLLFFLIFWRFFEFPGKKANKNSRTWGLLDLMVTAMRNKTIFLALSLQSLHLDADYSPLQRAVHHTGAHLKLHKVFNVKSWPNVCWCNLRLFRFRPEQSIQWKLAPSVLWCVTPHTCLCQNDELPQQGKNNQF